jgi:uridine kinase
MYRNIQVNTPGGAVTVPRGTLINDIVTKENFPVHHPEIIAVYLNNEVTSLNAPLDINAELRPITYFDPEGVRVYRRSLCFLFAMVIRKLFPDRRLVIGHSIANGYYYYYEEEREVPEEEINKITNLMQEYIRKDLPIEPKIYSYCDALEYFSQNRMEDTSMILEHRNENRIGIHTCDGYLDLSHGPLTAGTGSLGIFQVVSYGKGMILRYPRHADPYKILPFEPSQLLFSIYNEYQRWGAILNVNSAGKLNRMAKENRITDFIKVAEALHDKKIAEIAAKIDADDASGKIVLIAGPSSSGKTTFSKKLAIHLTVLGLNPKVINLDNYFLPREQTPKKENGEYDFESLWAIDVELLNQHLVSLIKGEEVDIPVFDFKEGKRKYGEIKLELAEKDVLMMEGIHALNDQLTPDIPPEKKFKVYVSALTQLNIDSRNRISTTDNRLIRRLVRDYKFRGHLALDTFRMWPGVREGENKNIFPYQDTADAAFNSALDYELGVLKSRAVPLLMEVKPYHQQYHESLRLLSFLENFVSIPDDRVPPYSILREFIGGSGFHY